MAEFKGGNTSLGGTSQGEPHPLYKTLQIKERNAKNRTGLSLYYSCNRATIALRGVYSSVTWGHILLRLRGGCGLWPHQVPSDLLPTSMLNQRWRHSTEGAWREEHWVTGCSSSLQLLFHQSPKCFKSTLDSPVPGPLPFYECHFDIVWTEHPIAHIIPLTGRLLTAVSTENQPLFNSPFVPLSHTIHIAVSPAVGCW